MKTRRISRRGDREATRAVIPITGVERAIHAIRGQRVMLDEDLARLYGVPTKVFNQAVRRNLSRFPRDFRFQLTPKEARNLRSQSVTSSFHGGRRYAPWAFTQEGVAMLSSVLGSPRAIAVNTARLRRNQRFHYRLRRAVQLLLQGAAPPAPPIALCG
jgi:hypothetical protein